MKEIKAMKEINEVHRALFRRASYIDFELVRTRGYLEHFHCAGLIQMAQFGAFGERYSVKFETR